MKFTLGTSYFDGTNSGSNWFFYNLWRRCVNELFDSKNNPEDVLIINVAGSKPPFFQLGWQTLNLTGDLGHIHQMIGKKLPAKKSFMSSWEAAVLTLAMIAYTNETDLIFLEQDCLAFGDWVGQLYREIGSKKMLFGKSNCMPCAQSLFIIKHDFLPTFVAEYIMLSNQLKLGEDKFVALERSRPNLVGRFSFGFDRDRPINFDAPVFYGQKFSADELAELRARGFIDYDLLPDGIGKFTNDA